MNGFNALATEVKLAIIAAIIVAAFAAGWAAEGWRSAGAIARLERDHATALATAESAKVAVLAAAQSLGDALTGKLNAATEALNKANEEKENAIRRLTAGRRCLDSAAVSVLNQRPEGIQPTGVSQTARQSVPDDAAFATDTDVGIWIAGCQRGYDTCRGRLQAIADFYTTTDAKQAGDH